MNHYTLTQFRDIAYQLSRLAGTFQTKPFYLRAKQIRQADKALISVNAFFSKNLYEEALQWKESYEGMVFLNKKMELLTQKELEVEELSNQIKNLTTKTKSWFDLEDGERLKIIQNAKRAKHSLQNKSDKLEAHTIHRFKRYQSLKELIPYSENAGYLCEAVFHYENREKYEKNIEKLEEKILGAKNRLKTVKMGFWLAFLFCFLVVTIPICFPFAINLWKRKREIEAQMANWEDSLRREQKRLVCADEGALIAHEIREILGNVSLDFVRQVLIEVKELRGEFFGLTRTAGSTVCLLNFMETNRDNLILIFGDMPCDILKSFEWLICHVEDFQNTEVQLLQLEEKINILYGEQKQIIRGYTKEIIKLSLDNLKDVISTKLPFPFENETKLYFVNCAMDIYLILNEIRDILYFVSCNYAVDLTYWDFLKMKILSTSNTFNLCILEGELLNSGNNSGPTDRIMSLSSIPA